jgi:hypothetical protein
MREGFDLKTGAWWFRTKLLTQQSNEALAFGPGTGQVVFLAYACRDAVGTALVSSVCAGTANAVPPSVKVDPPLRGTSYTPARLCPQELSQRL